MRRVAVITGVVLALCVAGRPAFAETAPSAEATRTTTSPAVGLSEGFSIRFLPSRRPAREFVETRSEEFQVRLAHAEALQALSEAGTAVVTDAADGEEALELPLPSREETERATAEQAMVLPGADEFPPGTYEDRTQVTTTTARIAIGFERSQAGWSQAETLLALEMASGGLKRPVPQAAILAGVPQVALLAETGTWNGLADPTGFLETLRARAAGRPDVLEILSGMAPEALTEDAKGGHDERLGWWLGTTYRMNAAHFVTVRETMPRGDPIEYVLACVPTGLEGREGRTCARFELVAFRPHLEDGILMGVPAELLNDFAIWVEGREVDVGGALPVVTGEGEAVVEMSGEGAVRFSLDRQILVDPEPWQSEGGAGLIPIEVFVHRVTRRDRLGL